MYVCKTVKRDQSDTLRMVTQYEKCGNLSEVARKENISRERVRQIVYTYLGKEKYLEIRSRFSKSYKKKDRQSNWLKRKLFRYGCTLEQYEKLQLELGAELFKAMQCRWHNTQRCSSLHVGGDSFQISLDDYIKLFIDYGKVHYDNENPKWVIEQILAIRPTVMVFRIDKTQGFVVGNLKILTRVEYGHWLADTHGLVPQRKNKSN